VRRAASAVLLLPGGHPVLGGLRVAGFRARLIAVFAVASVAPKQTSRSVAERGDHASGSLVGAD
jgi:hypothetical protein